MNNKIRDLFLQRPIAAISMLSLLILVPIIIAAIYTASTTRVDLLVAPEDAEIFLNGESVEVGRHRLRNGEYTLSAQRDQFEGATVDFAVEGEATAVGLVLEPLTEEAFRIVRQQESAFFAAEGAVGLQAGIEGERFRQENEILSNLPFRNMLYEIHYRSGENDSITLQIRANDQRRRDLALSQIRNWGFDPSDFEIEYID